MRSFRCSTGIFQVPKKSIRVCNGCNESCCAARIETRSKRATSVEIELALHLVACTASDAAQEFYKCPKIKKIRFCEKFAFATLATRVAARHASKPAENVPRAWKFSRRCNWLHAHHPMQHNNFPNARIFKKIRFCEKFAFATLGRRVAARHGSKP